MSVSHCLHNASRIAAIPNAEDWGVEIEKLPTECPHPDDCGEPRNCRERNREYLKMVYRIAKRNPTRRKNDG